jgi:hypothetical protein
MLSKLIKYDIRSTWRDFAGIYLSILLGVIIVPLILNNADSMILNMSAGFIATAIIIAVVVVTIINLFKIFNNNVFSKEGYLTMTLPVTSGQIITSKLLVSSMWIVLTGLISAIGIFIFTMIIAQNPFMELIAYIKEFFSQIGGKNTSALIFTVILLALSMVITTAKEIAKLFLACSIAHLKQLSRFRIPAGILSYFVFTWLETMIVQFFTWVAGLFSNNFSEIIIRMDSIKDPTQIFQFISYFDLITGIGMLYTLLLIIVYSIGTAWILNHKLDLD